MSADVHFSPLGTPGGLTPCRHFQRGLREGGVEVFLGLEGDTFRGGGVKFFWDWRGYLCGRCGGRILILKKGVHHNCG